QLASFCWARSASNKTKSSSHHAFSEQNRSKRWRALSAAEVTNLRPASNSNGIFVAKTRSYSTGSEEVAEKDAGSFSPSIQPRLARRSRLISSGLPANAEMEEYGE